MKKILGSLLATGLVLIPLVALADPATPVEVHAKTSYHDAQTQNQIQPTTPKPTKDGNGEFVEYFSVPVPGGQPAYGPAPTIQPQQPAGPPPAYAAMPSPAQVNNVYWQMANNPYPFGIVNFDGNDYYSAYGDYGYGYGYGYGGYPYYGNGGYGYGNGFRRGRFGHGLTGPNFNGMFFPNSYQTLTPNAFGVTTPIPPGFVTNGVSPSHHGGEGMGHHH